MRALCFMHTSFRWNALCEVRYTPPWCSRARARVLTGLEHAACCRYSVMYVSRHYREFAAVKLVHRGCTGKRSFSIPRFNSDSANSLPICIATSFSARLKYFPGEASFLFVPSHRIMLLEKLCDEARTAHGHGIDFSSIDLSSRASRKDASKKNSNSVVVRVQRVSRTVFRNSYVHAW